MTKFRDLSLPVDSFIMDYDWWDPHEQYNDSLPLDFGYDPIMFGYHNFTHPPGSTIPNAITNGSVELFNHFHKDIHMRFGGIRKPRTYSNQALSKANGWLLPDNFSVGAGPNNWNMSLPEWSNWWIPQTAHFTADGMDYFWNDEGETQWFTYSWWNIAEAAAQALISPLKRFWSINRSFQPGMQRHPGISWTGDAQDCSHTKALAFITAGQAQVACDMTSPSATVLVRQYINAIFLPIMRVHAMHGVPRFPYLNGGAEHLVAFRTALNLRYTFIPHIYSLNHLARRDLIPVAMPASYIFPNSSSFSTSLGDDVYMLGTNILPAVVSVSNQPDPRENISTIIFPPDTWYVFNSTEYVIGPDEQTFTNVPLSTIIFYIRAGSILTLQHDVVQYTDALGGLLDIHIYAGKDCVFTFFEDDGETTAYVNNPDTAMRITTFTWTDITKTLSWTVTGTYTGPQIYTMGIPILFDTNSSSPVQHAPITLGVAGSITF